MPDLTPEQRRLYREIADLLLDAWAERERGLRELLSRAIDADPRYCSSSHLFEIPRTADWERRDA